MLALAPMERDASEVDLRTPSQRPDPTTSPVLVYALSGMGKSTLAAAHPSAVLDADGFLYAAVADAFPDLDPRQRLRAWRDLCRSRPWADGGAALETWARVRRGFIAPFLAAMREGEYALVLTSLLDPPWAVTTYYGVERGRYLEHLSLAKRAVDNHQSEEMNHRLEGYSPLVRVPPGTYLGQRAELTSLLGDTKKTTSS